MNVVVTGSRNWTDEDAIGMELKALPEDTVLSHGGCRGADKIAGHIANELGFRVKEYPANWAEHGKAAGPVRNRRMLEGSEPDLVLAFLMPGSKGTKNCIETAESMGLNVKVIGPNHEG